jgi:hypothetical protein
VGQDLDTCHKKQELFITHNTKCRSNQEFVLLHLASPEQKEFGHHYTVDGEDRVAVDCPYPPAGGYAPHFASCLGGGWRCGVGVSVAVRAH